MAIKIREITGCCLHASTVRRWLPAAGLVWRRAAPTLHIRDPHKDEKMAAIHKALDECSAEHPVFYEDEVDIHLNPKIGADWQRRGHQKRVVTPGQNEKYYLAGALHSGTGKVSYVGGNSKGSPLFISLLKHLKATYRRAKTITLIVDNYIIHKSRETLRWLKCNPKFRVIYQPVYSPWVNHIERLWQALHETITRNHQCRSMWKLLKKVRHFGNDSNLLIVFYVQIVPDDFVMQLHRFGERQGLPAQPCQMLSQIQVVSLNSLRVTLTDDVQLFLQT